MGSPYEDDGGDLDAEVERELAALGAITAEEIAAAQAELGHKPYFGLTFDEESDDTRPDAPDEPAERPDPGAAMAALASALRTGSDEGAWDPLAEDEGAVSSAWGAYIGRGREKEQALEALADSIAEAKEAAAAVIVPARPDGAAGTIVVAGIEGYDVRAAGEGDVGERKRRLLEERAAREAQLRAEEEELSRRRAAAAREREEERRRHEEAAAAAQAEQERAAAAAAAALEEERARIERAMAERVAALKAAQEEAAREGAAREAHEAAERAELEVLRAARASFQKSEEKADSERAARSTEWHRSMLLQQAGQEVMAQRRAHKEQRDAERRRDGRARCLQAAARRAAAMAEWRPLRAAGVLLTGAARRGAAARAAAEARRNAAAEARAEAARAEELAVRAAGGGGWGGAVRCAGAVRVEGGDLVLGAWVRGGRVPCGCAPRAAAVAEMEAAGAVVAQLLRPSARGAAAGRSKQPGGGAGGAAEGGEGGGGAGGAGEDEGRRARAAPAGRAGAMEEVLAEVAGAGGLARLERAELNVEELVRLSAPALAACPRLVSLSLNVNALATLEGVEGAPGLEELSARENQLESMAAVAPLTRLGALSLGVNRISAVAGTPPPPPPSRTKWTRLVHPSVLIGHAHADRPGLARLGQLRALELHNNLIAALPDGCLGAAAPALERLVLYRNRLTSVGGALRGATRLSHLDLGRNRLASCAGIGDCRALETLILYENALEEFSTDELCLPLLRQLWLNGNRLAALPRLALLPSLEQLHAADNAISSLAALDGAAPAPLATLDVSFNALAALGALGPLAAAAHSLQRLQANDNPCAAEPPYRALALALLPALTELDSHPVPPAEALALRALHAAADPALLRPFTLGELHAALPALLAPPSAAPLPPDALPPPPAAAPPYLLPRLDARAARALAGAAETASDPASLGAAWAMAGWRWLAGRRARARHALTARQKREARAAALAAAAAAGAADAGGGGGGYGAVLRLAQAHSAQARALAEKQCSEMASWAPEVPRGWGCWQKSNGSKGVSASSSSGGGGAAAGGCEVFTRHRAYEARKKAAAGGAAAVLQAALRRAAARAALCAGARGRAAGALQAAARRRGSRAWGALCAAGARLGAGARAAAVRRRIARALEGCLEGLDDLAELEGGEELGELTDFLGRAPRQPGEPGPRRADAGEGGARADPGGLADDLLRVDLNGAALEPFGEAEAAEARRWAPPAAPPAALRGGGALPPLVRAGAGGSAPSGAGAGAGAGADRAAREEALRQEVAAHSAALRERKAAGAPRHELQPMVDRLLELKAAWSHLQASEPEQPAVALALAAPVAPAATTGAEEGAYGDAGGDVIKNRNGSQNECVESDSEPDGAGDGGVGGGAGGRRAAWGGGKGASAGGAGGAGGEREEELRVSNKSAAEIASEWGFSDPRTAERMLKKRLKYQRLAQDKARRGEMADPERRLARFRRVATQHARAAAGGLPPSPQRPLRAPPQPPQPPQPPEAPSGGRLASGGELALSAGALGFLGRPPSCGSAGPLGRRAQASNGFNGSNGLNGSNDVNGSKGAASGSRGASPGAVALGGSGAWGFARLDSASSRGASPASRAEAVTPVPAHGRRAARAAAGGGGGGGGGGGAGAFDVRGSATFGVAGGKSGSAGGRRSGAPLLRVNNLM